MTVLVSGRIFWRKGTQQMLALPALPALPHRRQLRCGHRNHCVDRRSGCSLSPAAVAAYGDLERAACYDALRPAYPSELLAEAVARAPPGGDLVDLGAGAGRLTRALLSLPSVQRYRQVIAVEPATAMRESFAAEGASCVHGCGESIPVENGSCSAVFCGESFHWMASIATLQEVYRVLSRDGILVLLWNTRDPQVSGFATQLEQAVISPLYANGSPRQQQHGAWESPFADSKSLFGTPERLVRSTTQKIEGSKLIDMVCGLSVVASKTQSEQVELKRTVFQFLVDHAT